MNIPDFFLPFLKSKISAGYILWGIVVLSFVLFLYHARKMPAILTDSKIAYCDTCGIGITDLVRQVKKELLALEDTMVKKNEDPIFKLKDFELEINFIVIENTSAKLQGKYELLTVEGSREYSNEKVQKLTLHWDAEAPKPGDIHVVNHRLGKLPFGFAKDSLLKK